LFDKRSVVKRLELVENGQEHGLSVFWFLENEKHLNAQIEQEHLVHYALEKTLFLSFSFILSFFWYQGF